ncbi:hypothetical protein BDV93DRAFT_564363 [Ceratobasidium sp. AG-I]|nr:hypothetical protein BDV93DRAFT_564363 [Ceratobasidium sp. AG-I]
MSLDPYGVVRDKERQIVLGATSQFGRLFSSLFDYVQAGLDQSRIIVTDAHPVIHLRTLGSYSPAQQTRDPNTLINIGPNTLKNNQVIRTVVPRHICVLAAGLESSNLGWRPDISARMCARFITHLFSHLFSHLHVPLVSPQLGTTPYLMLSVADSPSGTCLDRSRLTSTTGNPSRKLSGSFSSAVTKKRNSVNIITTPTDLFSRGCPNEFKIFFDYCCALRFDNKLDYLHICKLIRDLFVPRSYQSGYVSDWGTQRLSNPNNKPIRHVVAGNKECEA